MSSALGVGFLVLLLALALLRAGQGANDGRRLPPPEVRRRLAWLRWGGMALLALAVLLTGLLGGARDVVLLLAAGSIGGWALAMTVTGAGKTGNCA